MDWSLQQLTWDKLRQPMLKRAPLLAGLRSLLQPGSQPLQEQTSERKTKTLPEAISSMTDYIISVHACKSYAINAVSGFIK